MIASVGGDHWGGGGGDGYGDGDGGYVDGDRLLLSILSRRESISGRYWKNKKKRKVGKWKQQQTKIVVWS